MTVDGDSGSSPEHRGEAGLRRGRPPRFTPPAAHDHLPLGQPLGAMSPTAHAMLDAGRRLLAERGFRALTLEAVALEAGASKSSLVSHFGSRVGFLAMLFDSLTHDASVQIGAEMGTDPAGTADVTLYMASLADLYSDAEIGRAFHAIAANALTDGQLRARLADMYRWYRELHMERLRACRGSDALTSEEILTLASLLDAVEDGLALQLGMDPDGFDPRPVFELFGHLVGLYFADRAGAHGRGEPAPAASNDD
jgi:AcrR family transcriptional regulator